jgi:NTE family protein
MTDSSLRAGQTPIPFPTFTQVVRRLRRAPLRRLNLALQGGGAHGAFTWGVLDALLDQPDLSVEGLSGSSAGAMNAVVFADGWMKGGAQGAREGLTRFWTEVGQQMPWGLMTQGEGHSISLSPASKLMANWAGYFSPSQLNPLDLNPLRDLLNRQIDFAGLRAHSPFKLFVGTTQANTGKLRLFRESELTVEVLLASACLPRIHHALEIDGEAYWDGGYSANPAVFPLLYECDSRYVLLVLLNPLDQTNTPGSIEEIETRIGELSFSANFMREMRMFARAADFAGPSWWTRGRLEQRLQAMRFHMIDTNQVESLQRSATKLIAYAPFLQLLHSQGRECGTQWLDAQWDNVGRRPTINVKRLFG